MTRRKRPWRDNRGRLSPLKLLVFIALLVPGAWTIVSFPLGELGARPLNEAIHQFGLWGYRFLLIALAVTPFHRLLQWPLLVLVRRMVGVAAFAYVATHFLLYVVDQAFDLGKVASEIVLRFYLTIGFIAFAGLTVLAATSTDAMVHRLGGRNWSRLQRTVYVIGILATIHYFLQRKLEIYEPTVTAGLLAWLMGYRILARTYGESRLLPSGLVALLSLVAALATAAGELAYFRLVMGIDPALILAADLSLEVGLRPCWVVLIVGAAVTIVAALRTWLKRAPARLR